MLGHVFVMISILSIGCMVLTCFTEPFGERRRRPPEDPPNRADRA